MLLNPLSHLSVSVRACGSGGALRAGVFGELAASVSLGFQPGKVGGHYRRGWADAEVIPFGECPDQDHPSELLFSRGTLSKSLQTLSWLSVLVFLPAASFLLELSAWLVPDILPSSRRLLYKGLGPVFVPRATGRAGLCCCH